MLFEVLHFSRDSSILSCFAQHPMVLSHWLCNSETHLIHLEKL